MRILYDRRRRIFCHDERSISTYAFGLDSFLLQSKKSGDSYAFPIGSPKGGVIPLIGILADKDRANRYRGNFELFKTLQEIIQDAGAMCFVFSPGDIECNTVSGIAFSDTLDRWVTCHFPLPNVIYNRVPTPAGEQNEAFLNVTSWSKDHKIPFFNPHFFNKWEIYQILREREELRPHLPATEQIRNSVHLKEFLTEHKQIYIKHSLSSKGKGIRKVEVHEDGRVICRSIKKIEHFSSAERLAHAYPEWFREKDWIVQEAIQCRSLNGHRYDYRVLVLSSEEGFSVTGIGVRMSHRQEVTTHVPSGGTIISLDDVAKEDTKLMLASIMKICGETLTESLGFIGEFSADIAPRKEEGFVLFEINSKPMIFDELDIETTRRKKLVDTFFSLASSRPQRKD
ncbi:YheC/YheD family protein [Rossellomorea marisflavi]|uniref:YheC/YheD family endospore coat-associated protein n=1 Tax=Rossellomorea marisflavi TaxID=189381 RepID=UPI003457D8F5